jgi:hypothetical protein
MANQNVTVSLPLHVIRKAKHLAVDRGLSLSRFVAELVEEQVNGPEHQEQPFERQKRLMHEGLDLGFKGHIPWSRDDLHAR